jgi:hypothetical protein
MNLEWPVNIILVIKSRRMRWSGHAAGIGEKRNAYSVLVREPEDIRHYAAKWYCTQGIIRNNRTQKSAHFYDSNLQDQLPVIFEYNKEHVKIL